MMTDIRQRIGAQLRALREAKSLTTRELAELAGLDHSHISKIERGAYNLRIDTLDKITTALGAAIKIESPEPLFEWQIVEEVKKWSDLQNLHYTKDEDDWMFIDYKNYKITVRILEVCDESGIYTELNVTAYNEDQEVVDFEIPVHHLTSASSIHILLDKLVENLL